MKRKTKPEYGINFQPEDKLNGDWILQTDNSDLIRRLKLRVSAGSKAKNDSGFHWRERGRGTSFMFQRRFRSRALAKSALKRFLSDIATGGVRYLIETKDSGFTVKTIPTEKYGEKTPSGASKMSRCNSTEEAA